MAKKTKDTTTLPAINSSLQVKLDGLLVMKAQIEEQANNCLLIQVVDENTLAVAQQNLSKLNQLVKKVDDKKDELKRPVIDEGRAIESTAKSLTEKALKALEHLKEQVKAWEKKRIADEAAKEAELQAKIREAAELANKEAERVAGIRESIAKAQTALQSYYNSATTPAQCDMAIDIINKNYKTREHFQEFEVEAYTLKDNYIELIRTKKVQLEQGDNMSEAEKKLAAQKAALVNEEIEIARRKAELKSQEDFIRSEKERKEAEAKLLAEQAAAETDKTRNTRVQWKFELVDKSKLIPEWTCMDESAVKAYLKENKENLKDGEILNGVKFIKDFTVTA